jgi:hypothetical protein
MKEYPSIQGEIVRQPVYAFDKLDGSNVRAEWSKKRGFYKFGKRHGLVDETDPLLGEAKGLIQERYSDALDKIFAKNRWQNAVCFFEFFGPNSFAGLHAEEPHEVVLFDVGAEKKGILDPRDFLKMFSDQVKTAALLYHGNPNSILEDAVRSGQLEGMTFEGVVCKGKFVSPGRPLMFKIKSKAWIEKVKARYAGQPAKLAELL